MQASTTVRNATLDAIETAIGTTPKLQLRTGAVPANCAAADSGILIGEMALPSDWLAAASGASKAKAGTWSVAASGAGDIAHYRIKDSAGTNCHLQGAVSYSANAWAGTTAYTVGQRVRNGGNVYICTTAGTSAASGGPTGTGSGITDGSVVWNYVQAYAEMQVDNINASVGQTLTVSTFTITGGNA